MSWSLARRRPHAHRPSLVPFLSLLAGVIGASAPVAPPVLALAALLVAGLVLGSRGGGAVVALAAGLWIGDEHWQSGERALAGVDRGRPVRVEGLVASHPSRAGEEQVVTIALTRLAQGSRVATPDAEVLAILPAEPLVTLGERMSLQGYLQRATPLANPGLRDVPGPWRLRVKSARLVRLIAPPGGLGRASAQLRRLLEEILDPRTPGLRLARALVLGDASRLPPEWGRGLRRLGLSHVLSVSGLHLALLVATVGLIATPAGRRSRAVVILVAVVAYVLAVGPQPALLRSALMCLLALAALATGRPPIADHALAVAAGLLLVWRPGLIGELGFQLTVSATAGLVILAPRLAARWSALPRWLSRPLSATVAAQLVTLPFALPIFAQVSPLSPLANLVVVPWIGLVQAAAFAWTAIAALAPAVGGWLVPTLDLLTRPLDWLAAPAPARWWLWTVSVSPTGGLLVAIAVGVVAWWPRRPAVLAVGTALALLITRDAGPSAEPTLTMLDVGQGDAILLSDGGRHLLVDGGGWASGDFAARVLVPSLAALGVGHLDAVLSSHGDRDHCGGLVGLLAYLPVRTVALGPDWEAEACLRELRAMAQARLRVVATGSRLTVGRWQLEVLSPAGGERTGDNERSVVALATAGPLRVLLTGDIGTATEAHLVELGHDLRADVLKVGHHGSRGSTSAALLAAVRPRLALVPVGRRNPYGHPAVETLSRLRAGQARVLRSDRHGQVTIGVRGLESGRPSISITAPRAGMPS